MLVLDHHGRDQRSYGEEYFCQLHRRQPRGAWLIQYLEHGQMYYRDRNGAQTLSAGSVFCARLSSAVSYGFHEDITGPAIIRWAVIRGNECDAIMQPLCMQSFVFQAQAANINQWFGDLITGASRERIADAYAAACCIYQCLIHLPRILAQEQSPINISSATEDALRLLINNPLHPWSIDELAIQCGCNRDHLSRTAKKRLGMNPLRWLHQERLHAAEQLLQDTDMSINNIAEQCGFGNAQALARHIRSKHGVGPRAFRAA